MCWASGPANVHQTSGGLRSTSPRIRADEIDGLEQAHCGRPPHRIPWPAILVEAAAPRQVDVGVRSRPNRHGAIDL